MEPQGNQKKGEWSPQEDRKLYDRVTGSGTRNWTQISKDAGLLRSGKSCRLRWMNYLRPDLKRGGFTIEEIELILHYHQLLGNKWSMIASYLPGRTDNAIKNFYHTYNRKRLRSGNVIKSNSPQRDLNKNKQKRKLMMSSTSSSGSEGLFSFPILESYALREDPSGGVLVDGSVESSSISLPESDQDGETHEEGWIDHNIFEELFPIEDEFMHGMNSIPFGYDEFSSWENMSFPETSPYEYSTLLSTQDFDYIA